MEEFLRITESIKRSKGDSINLGFREISEQLKNLLVLSGYTILRDTTKGILLLMIV